MKPVLAEDVMAKMEQGLRREAVARARDGHDGLDEGGGCRRPSMAALLMGGNLCASNPDSTMGGAGAGEGRVQAVPYHHASISAMSMACSGGESLILPVTARDEEWSRRREIHVQLCAAVGWRGQAARDSSGRRR